MRSTARSRGLCRAREKRRLAYVAVMPRDFRITLPSGAVIKAEDVVHEAVFDRRSCESGSKAPVRGLRHLHHEQPRHFLLIRSLISRPADLTF